jgi:hypothetical protein
MAQPGPLIACTGCGAPVPDSDGAVHRYLGMSPGCFEIYGEVVAREYTDYRYGAVHNLSVDAYALQHPGTESPQTIKSAAVHLISLYLQLEHDYNSMQAARIKQQAAGNSARYHWLIPPAPAGAITVVEVHRASDASEHARIVRQWAAAVWQAWSVHHDTVREWAALCSGAGRTGKH